MTLSEFKRLLVDILAERNSKMNSTDISLMAAGYIEALIPLGIIKKGQHNSEESLTGSVAEYFLDSYWFFVKNQHTLINDWERIGGEFKNPELMFERGIRLLSLFEKRRSQFEGAHPLRELKVVKAIIRAKDLIGNKYFLMHLDDKSHYYQMIGGKIKSNELPLDALIREMSEEIPNFDFKYNKDYFVDELEKDFYDLSFVSPKYGVITKYSVRHYFIRFNKRMELKGSLRWVSEQELLLGVTEDGFGTIPPGEEFKLVNKQLSNDQYSFSEILQISDTKINVGDKFEPKQKTNSYMAINLLGEAEIETDHSKCFVIMPYSETWSSAVEKIIEKVCKEHSITLIIAKNMDGRFIPNDIWKGITGSGLIIADLTGGNPNVTYEVGLSDVLGKESILICQGTKIPFDFSGQRLLTYENSLSGTIELEQKLCDRIKIYKQSIQHKSYNKV